MIVAESFKSNNLSSILQTVKDAGKHALKPDWIAESLQAIK